jgi:hypothetical protein
MTARGNDPERVFSEREVEAMKDRELMDFIGETVATLHRLGDRLEAFAVPAGGTQPRDYQDRQHP